MQFDRFWTHVIAVTYDAIIDTGRLLLFLVILSMAPLLSILLAMQFYGVLSVPSGTRSLYTTFVAGSHSAVQLLYSFTDAQLFFYLLSLYSALFTGVFAYLLYQRAISGIGYLRQWA